MQNIPTEIYTKLDRADAKFLNLKKSIEDWCNDNILTLKSELRPQRQGLNLTCNMQDLSVPIENWRLDFGELIYTLRSALDNLVFFCARQHLDPPKKPRSLFFQIFTDAEQFSKGANAIISQLSPEVSALVEKIQPYHREKPDVGGAPEYDPLVSLNFLSNLDKHRMPIPFLVPPQEIIFKQACQFYSDADAEANTPPNVIVHVDALVHGKTVMEYITNCPIKEAAGEFHIRARVAIDVNNYNRDFFEIMEQLTWYTRLIVEEFEKTLTSISTLTVNLPR